MATEFISQGIYKAVIMKNLTAKYGEPKVGRWAKPPYTPDRCEFCPLIDIKPAISFVTDNLGWRLGYCPEHLTKASEYVKELNLENHCITKGVK
jgi:hypothetical protein